MEADVRGQCVTDSFRWPLEYSAGARGLDALLAKLLAGINLITDFSGIGQAEAAVHYVQVALKLLGHSGFRGVQVTRSSDILASCRRVLAAIRDATGSGCCILGDMTKGMDQSVLKDIRALQDEHRKMIRSTYRSQQVRKQHIRKLGRKFLKAARARIVAQLPEASEVMAHCYTCKRKCNAFPKTSEPVGLTGNISGTMCTPWSRMGKQFGWLDPASIPFLVLTSDILVAKYAFVIIECTPGFDVDALVMLFPECTVRAVTFSPHQLGFPQRRERVYVVVLRDEKLKWRLDYNIKNFSDQFFREHLLFDAEDYLRAPESSLSEFRKFLASAQHMPEHVDGGGSQWPWLSVIGGSKKRRLQQKEATAATQGFGKHSHLFWDLRQSSLFTHYVETDILPTFLRRTFVWSNFSRRPVHPHEALEAQGVPIFVPAGSPFQCLWRDVLSGHSAVSLAKCQSFAGNAMHAAAVGSVFLFMCCNTDLQAAA